MIREITIRPVLNGYKVQVGCQEVVFTSRDNLINELREYLERPDLVEGIYLKSALNDPKAPCPPPATAGLGSAGQYAPQQYESSVQDRPTIRR